MTALVAPSTAQSGTDAEILSIDLLWSERYELESQRFEMPRGTARELAGVPEGSSIVLSGFPVAPAVIADLKLERFDPYAEGSRVLEGSGETLREVERSARLHFLGHGVDLADLRVGLSVDPDGANVRALVSQPTGMARVARSAGESSSPDRELYEITVLRADGPSAEDTTRCETVCDRSISGPDPPPIPNDPIAAAGGGPIYEAILAFDTDGELVQHFGSAAATNDAIGDLVTALNVIYERDLSLRLLQGHTVLRPDPDTDPFVAPAIHDQHDELGEWWRDNMQGVPQVFVALISGKSPSGRGLAWIDVYCSPRYSNSISRIVRSRDLDHPTNLRLIAHEIGHNGGSDHTHCYTPEIDQCFRGEAGCYAGSTSCPDWADLIPGVTAGRGTLMSYCSRGGANGAGCGANAAFFHPTVASTIMSRIQANRRPGCVEAIPTIADLSVTKTDASDPVLAGTGLTYRIEVANAGPDLAGLVEVFESLPDGMSFVSTEGCENDPSGVPLCELGDLESGASRSYTVVVGVDPATSGVRVNEASVSAPNDPVPENDAAAESTLVETPESCATGPIELGAAESTASATFLTESTVTAGNGFVALAGGTVRLHGASVVLGDGFSVATGADLRATSDPLVDCL